MKINGRYRLLQAGYWMLFCVGYGYATLFLLDRGMTSGQIGIVTAAFGAAAAILQPLLGRLSDRSVHWNWKTILLVLSALSMSLNAALLPLPAKWVSGVCYGGFLLCISTMMPFVNTANFYYQERGHPIDFGAARGLGSLSYAALSLLLGRLTASAGVRPVPAAGLAVSLFLLLSALSLPRDPTSPDPAEQPEQPEIPPPSGNFFRRYPAFTKMLIASVLLLAFHNMTNTYLIQMLEHVGGDSGSLGAALAISAVMELPVLFTFSRIIRHHTAAGLLVVSGVNYILKGALFLFAANVGMIYVAELFQVLSFALYAAASVYYAQRAMAPADKITGQAYMSSTVTIGAVLGNLIGGWLLELSGVRVMLLVALSLAVAGAVFAVSSWRGEERGATA